MVRYRLRLSAGTDIEYYTVFGEVIDGVLCEVPPDVAVSLTSFNGSAVRAVKLEVYHDSINIIENAEQIVIVDFCSDGLSSQIVYIRDSWCAADGCRVEFVLPEGYKCKNNADSKVSF